MTVGMLKARQPFTACGHHVIICRSRITAHFRPEFASIAPAASGATTTSSTATRDSCFLAEAKFTCMAEMRRRAESLILAESELPAFEQPTL
jgi:hypothetical protein